MLRHRLAAAAFVASIFPAAASAQDTLPAGASAPERSSPLSTGFRLEAIVGYEDAAFDSISRADGVLYGVGAGYDFALNRRLRLGLEAEATDSSAKACWELFGIPGVTGQVCQRASRDLYAGARLGVQVSPSVLLYGKAGYSNYRESNSFPPPLLITETHPHMDGWRLGGGAEVALGRHTFVKAEYRYSNYEQSQHFNKHQAVMGFGFRF